MSETRKIGTVLLVDDDSTTIDAVLEVLGAHDLEVVLARSASEALTQLGKIEVDLVLANVDAIAGSDLDSMDRFTDLETPPEFVLTTDHPSVDGAAEAVKKGAAHYLSKPLDLEALRKIAQRAVGTRRLAQENTALRRLVSRQEVNEKLVAKSSKMREVLEIVGRVAEATASVLITGETGSGKGLIAQTIHQLSARAAEPFVAINCGGLQEQLLESELFGYAKGAFTGATGSKLGLFEVAHGGTLFLDEIAEMSPAMQTRLLQVLDSGQLRQVGGTKFRQVDTRIIAATNKNLKKEVRAENFREDLFYRLNVVRIRVPPLRDRVEDIPGLVEIFLAKHRPRERDPKTISRGTLRVLMQYHWPGNVRELANLIESMSLLSVSTVIQPEDLPPMLQPAGAFESMAIEVPLPFTEMERLHILRALDFTEGKKAPAARLLGIDVKTLSNKIKAYKIET